MGAEASSSSLYVQLNLQVFVARNGHFKSSRKSSTDDDLNEPKLALTFWTCTQQAALPCCSSSPTTAGTKTAEFEIRTCFFLYEPFRLQRVTSTPGPHSCRPDCETSILLWPTACRSIAQEHSTVTPSHPQLRISRTSKGLASACLF